MKESNDDFTWASFDMVDLGCNGSVLMKRQVGLMIRGSGDKLTKTSRSPLTMMV